MRLGNGKRADALTDGRINVRHRRDALQERVEIEPCAADEDGGLALAMGLVDLRACLAGPSRGAIILHAVDMTEQAVRRAGQFLGGRACGDDGEIGIDLARIGIDDDAVMALREAQGDCALAAGGRPGNKRDRRPIRVGQYRMINGGRDGHDRDLSRP